MASCQIHPCSSTAWGRSASGNASDGAASVARNATTFAMSSHFTAGVIGPGPKAAPIDEYGGELRRIGRL